MTELATAERAPSGVRRTGLRTRDVDVARTEIARLFCPHELRPSRSGLDVRMRTHGSGPVQLVGLDYGHPVRIRPGELGSFYLVQLPLSGSARIDQGRERTLSNPAVGAVLSPTDPVDMVWGERTPQLLCRIDRTALDEEFRLLTGDSPRTPVRFRAAMPVAEPAARTWLASLRRSWQGADRPDGAAGAHRALLTSLLLSQPHNHTLLLTRPASDESIARRAVAFMESRLDSQLSIPQVSAGVGVGVRVLQRAFRVELDTTPLAWLKRRRLELAHERLLAAVPGTATVTAVAADVGLTHLGRFALEYHAMFGENPSETLARPVAPALS